MKIVNYILVALVLVVLVEMHIFFFLQLYYNEKNLRVLKDTLYIGCNNE